MSYPSPVMRQIRLAKRADTSRLTVLAEQTFRSTFAADNTVSDMDVHCRASCGEAIQCMRWACAVPFAAAVVCSAFALPTVAVAQATSRADTIALPRSAMTPLAFVTTPRVVLTPGAHLLANRDSPNPPTSGEASCRQRKLAAGAVAAAIAGFIGYGVGAFPDGGTPRYRRNLAIGFAAVGGVAEYFAYQCDARPKPTSGPVRSRASAESRTRFRS